LVAEVEGEVAGYVSILTKVSSGELQDGDIEYGLVPDLVILPGYRGNGIGRILLAAAEDYAKDHQVKWLRIGVMNSNQNAKELYLSSGYCELYVELEKNLGQEVRR
jgi:ribosomal protein S18 acetylase RimI-like enzyme